MGPVKKLYLDRIRSESAYPAFRSVINVIALLFYCLGGLFFAGAFLGGFQSGSPFLLVAGAAMGLLYLIIGKVLKEISLMLADIADSVIDANSHNEFKPEE